MTEKVANSAAAREKKSGPEYERLSAADVEALERFCSERRQLAELADKLSVPSADALALRRKSDQHVARGLGVDLDESRAEMISVADADRDTAMLTKPFRQHSPKPKPTPEPPSHEFWWTHTVWSNPPSAITATDTPAGVYLYGQVNHDADRRVIHRWSLEAFFGLQRPRLIASPWNTWWSRPAIEMSGFAAGYTFGRFVLSPDDKWAKLRIRCAHQVLQILNGYAVVVGENSELHTVINEENNSRWAFNRLLPTAGFHNLSPAVFHLADDSADLFGRVEINIEFELEGMSALRFGYHEHAPSSSGGLFNTCQWTPYPYDFINDTILVP